MNERNESIMDFIREFDPDLYPWPTNPEKLINDIPRGIYRTSHSQKTLDAIFGPFDAFRNCHNPRYGIGKLLKFSRSKLLPPPELPGASLNLPEDAIVITNGETVGVIISAAHQCVVKLERHIYASHFQDVAEASSEAFRQAGMDQSIPALQKSGKSSQGIYYRIYELCENLPPFLKTYHGRAWPKTLARHILPILEKFHTHNGVTLASPETWAEAITTKASSRNLPPHLTQQMHHDLKNFVSNVNSPMPIGMISGDLQPQNIHFSRAGTKILDWSNTQNAGLIIDIFSDVFYRSMAEPNNPSSKAFWAFLRGDTPLSETLRATADVWSQWMRSWHGIETCTISFHHQLQAMYWDWLVTMEHPWNPQGGLWPHIYLPPRSASA